MATFTFTKETKIIQINSPDLVTTIQELVDAIREYEDDLDNLDQPKIIDATGKDDLGFALTAITLRLLDDWRIKFQDTAGPSRVSAIINGGNIVATNSFNNNPIAAGAFVDVTIAQAVSGILVDSATADIKKIRQYTTNKSTISGNQMHVFDDDGTTEVQTYDLDTEDGPKSKTPV